MGREWVSVWEYSNACDGRTLFNISFVLLDSSEIKWSAKWLEAVSQIFLMRK